MSSEDSLASDDCSPYVCHSHSMRIMSRMQDYHVAGQLCDITLVAGDRRIAAHRLVLSSASDYFEAMFTNDVVEATQSEVNIHDVDPDALEHLVQYMYTGKSVCVCEICSISLFENLNIESYQRYVPPDYA